MKNLLLIDGNNFAFRSAFTVKSLNFAGEPTNVLFGFIKNYYALKKNYPDYYPVVVWDGGYKERLELSQKAVDDGLIDRTYKQCRRDKKANQTDEEAEEMKQFFDQINVLREFLEKTIIGQYQIENNEADDVIASLVNKYKTKYDSIKIVTSDKDYYQLLDDENDVTIYDAINKKHYTESLLKLEYGITPSQWIDLGAFTGDGSDDIIGCKGFGLKTTLPFLKEYKTVEGVLSYFHSLVDSLLKSYPHYEETDPEGDNTITNGIRKALEDRQLKKISFKKVILNAIDQEEIIKLAYVLKKMKNQIELSELVEKPEGDEFEIETFFSKYKLDSLRKGSMYLSGKVELGKTKLDKIVETMKKNRVSKLYHCEKCDKEFMMMEIAPCPFCGCELKNGKLMNVIQPTLF